ncbi:MAG: 6-phospho-3-hexuloisomerase [Terriglobia bacterium]|jgi:6-phospho-3-hexuloisomerase
MDFSETENSVLKELGQTLERVDPAAVDEMVQFLAEAKSVFVAGAGRSGLMIRSFAMRLAHLGLSVQVVGEVTTRGIGQGDVLLVASGSGETRGILAMAHSAIDHGAKVGVITIFPESSLARLAQCRVLIPAPTPKSGQDNAETSIQPMGTLFEQSLLLTLDVIVMMLMEKLGRTSEQMFKLHANLE